MSNPKEIKATVCLSIEVSIPKEILDKAKTYEDKRRLFIKKATLHSIMQYLMEKPVDGCITSCQQDINLIN